MHYLLWLEWRRFYTGDNSPEPTIVTRDSRVLDANAAAEAREIRRGIDLPQARMLCRDCVVREWHSDEHVDRQRAWLDICAEFTGIIEPIDQHIAVLDLTGHPQRLEIVDRLVRALLLSVRLPLLYGAAPTQWIAKLAAHQHDLGLATENPETFLADLPMEDLLPVKPEDRQRLKFLGYHKIGEAVRIPLDVLKAQFGEAGLTIFKAVRGGCYQPVQPLYPLDSIRECFLFESPVSDWGTVDEVLSILAGRISQRLNGRQSSTLELSLEREDGTLINRTRRFTKPIANAIAARSALRLLLPEPGDDCPISAIRITLKDLEQVRLKQNRLVEAGNRPAATSAINYLQNTFGKGTIKLASEVEIPRRERLLSEWRRTLGWQ